MSDDSKQTTKPDDSRIDTNQDHDVEYWAKEFGVSPEALREAVQKVGPVARDVRHRLGRYTAPESGK